MTSAVEQNKILTDFKNYAGLFFNLMPFLFVITLISLFVIPEFFYYNPLSSRITENFFFFYQINLFYLVIIPVVAEGTVIVLFARAVNKNNLKEKRKNLYLLAVVAVIVALCYTCVAHLMRLNVVIEQKAQQFLSINKGVGYYVYIISTWLSAFSSVAYAVIINLIYTNRIKLKGFDPNFIEQEEPKIYY